mgnify:CR=1 FL=1
MSKTAEEATSTTPKGRALRARAPRGSSCSEYYDVLSTTNLLRPVAGSSVKVEVLESLIADGVKVVVVAK